MATGVGGGSGAGEVGDRGAVEAHNPLVGPRGRVYRVKHVKADGAEVATVAVEDAVGAEAAVAQFLLVDGVEEPPLLRRAAAAALVALRRRRWLLLLLLVVVLSLHWDSRI